MMSKTNVGNELRPIFRNKNKKNKKASDRPSQGNQQCRNSKLKIPTMSFPFFLIIGQFITNK